MALRVAELVTGALRKEKARSVEEEHSSINTTRGNMVNFPRTPQQMSLPAVASEAETMATPQQASSSYPRPEPPSPPRTIGTEYDHHSHLFQTFQPLTT